MRILPAPSLALSPRASRPPLACCTADILEIGRIVIVKKGVFIGDSHSCIIVPILKWLWCCVQSVRVFFTELELKVSGSKERVLCQIGICDLLL